MIEDLLKQYYKNIDLLESSGDIEACSAQYNTWLAALVPIRDLCIDIISLVEHKAKQFQNVNIIDSLREKLKRCHSDNTLKYELYKDAMLDLKTTFEFEEGTKSVNLNNHPSQHLVKLKQSNGKVKDVLSKVMQMLGECMSDVKGCDNYNKYRMGEQIQKEEQKENNNDLYHNNNTLIVNHKDYAD